MNQREKVWMGGKQPEESPEGSVRSRQARERNTAEGNIQRDGASFRAIKKPLFCKDKGKSKNWSIMVQQIGKDIKGGK